MGISKEEAIKELQNRETVFVAYSQATKLPYVKCDEETYNDQAWIFSTEEGIKECQENLNYYKKNAKVIADTLTELQIPFYGGIHSPYIWFECPNGMDSWSCFDYLLENIQVVGTPGAGFGENGKNYFRLTSFGTYESTVEAMNRFKKLFAK